MTPEKLLGQLLADAPNPKTDDLILDVMVLCACADGIEGCELEALPKLARELPSFREAPADEIGRRVTAAIARVEEDGVDERFRALSELDLPVEDSQRMFRAAALMQHADGRVSRQEEEFLVDLSDVLGLSESEVRLIQDEIATSLGAV